ncbi:MAG TPA: thioredoxin family protein [Pirellulales bacterium]|jgi:thiol:disulfide interchange protein/DsbC/DsbD-like thiol-disulfide interchange protein|nr:thioredoxin family protein [Pirellulales bacterium]
MSKVAPKVARSAGWLGAAMLLVWSAGLPAHAQQVVGLPGLDLGKVQTPVAVTAEVVPGAGGEPAQLVVHAKMQDGWHIYSTTQPPGGPVRTKITLAADSPAKLAGEFQPTPAPEKHPEPAFNNITVETHAGDVTWRAGLSIPPGTDLAQLVVSGKVFVQACTDTNCLPPQNVPFEARLAPGSPAQTAPAATQPAVKPQPAAKPQASAPLAVETLGKYTHALSHAIIEGRIEPQVVTPGSRATLHLRATPTDGYYIYALASKPTDFGPKPTLIQLTRATACTDSTPRPSEKPQSMQTTTGQAVGYHTDPVEWTIDLCTPDTARAGALPVEGLIGYMTCLKDGSCDLPRAAKFSGILNVGTDHKNGSLMLRFEDAKYSQVAALALAAPPPTVQATHGITPAIPLAPTNEPPRDLSALPWMILSALLGGLILNLMPCVLPVIGLKIFSFVEQAGESRRVALLLNLWYTLGVLAVFMVLATLASAAKLGLADSSWGWGQQNSSVVFNIAMCSIVFVMALSFLGVWEIPIPGFVGSGKAQDLAAREGAFGAFTKGIVTTVLSTACSGPFLGPVLGFTLTQPPFITYLICGFIGLGMASPYLIIGAFPELVRFLPKPGAWMDTFKQAMGFVMMGAIVFLFSAMPKREYVVPTFCLLVGLWAGCWWIGRTPLYAGAAKLAKAYTIGGLITAVVGIAGFKVLLPSESLIAWRPYSQQALQQLTAEGKTVMVDFTADWCLTCKTNLNFVINTPEVSDAVRRAGVVPLIVDLTDPDSEDWKVLNSLGFQSIPMLAIFPAHEPQRPITLPDLLTKNKVLDALEKAGPSKQTPRTARR